MWDPTCSNLHHSCSTFSDYELNDQTVCKRLQSNLRGTVFGVRGHDEVCVVVTVLPPPGEEGEHQCDLSLRSDGAVSSDGENSTH